MVVSYAVDDIVGLIACSVIGYSIDGLVDCMSAILWDFLFIYLAVVGFFGGPSPCIRVGGAVVRHTFLISSYTRAETKKPRDMISQT